MPLQELADTLVSTETGLRSIAEIAVGDYVWSENTETGEKELKKVLAVSVTESKSLVHVTLSDGTKIDTTENHPFYTEDKGWCAAGELETGDVISDSKSRAMIASYFKKKSKQEFVRWGFNQYTGLYFRSVHTYNIHQFKNILNRNSICCD